MSRYRKRPVEIEAFQLKRKPWPDWFGKACEDGVVELYYDNPREVECAIIHTLEGDHRAEPDDYIIQGVKGELYPCKNSRFKENYEEV